MDRIIKFKQDSAGAIVFSPDDGMDYAPKEGDKLFQMVNGCKLEIGWVRSISPVGQVVVDAINAVVDTHAVVGTHCVSTRKLPPDQR